MCAGGVQRNVSTQGSTSSAIQQQVSKFLRGASDREGGRKRRVLEAAARKAKRKAAQQAGSKAAAISTAASCTGDEEDSN